MQYNLKVLVLSLLFLIIVGHIIAIEHGTYLQSNKITNEPTDRTITFAGKTVYVNNGNGGTHLPHSRRNVCL